MRSTVDYDEERLNIGLWLSMAYITKPKSVDGKATLVHQGGQHDDVEPEPEPEPEPTTGLRPSY